MTFFMILGSLTLSFFSQRIVSLPGVKVPFEYDELQSSFVLQYEKLYKEQPITITSDSEEMYDRITAPQLVILDVSYKAFYIIQFLTLKQHFCYNALKGIRGISGSTIPIYAWQSCAVANCDASHGCKKLINASAGQPIDLIATENLNSKAWSRIDVN